MKMKKGGKKKIREESEIKREKFIIKKERWEKTEKFIIINKKR